MKVVVTGASSFIGRCLLNECRKIGIDPIGFDTILANEPRIIQGDIRSRDIADLIPEGADALVHLAAISRDVDCQADLKLACDVNISGTVNLLQASQKRKVKQFVFASSEWVYGNLATLNQQEDREINLEAIQSEYALTKIVGEQFLRLACQRGFNAATVLRFAIVYGPRLKNWSAVEQLFDNVRRKDEVEVGSLQTARRFIFVEDVARGILASLGRRGYEVFNLSGPRLVTLGEIIETSQRLLGKNIRIIETNASRLSIRNPDDTKARHCLNWKAEVDLADGLRSLREFLDANTGAI